MNIKWDFLLLALLAVISISGLGVAIAEKSLLIAIICVIVLFGVMGFGFSRKKKLREVEKI